jgi:hypothetical protein
MKKSWDTEILASFSIGPPTLLVIVFYSCCAVPERNGNTNFSNGARARTHTEVGPA